MSAQTVSPIEPGQACVADPNLTAQCTTCGAWTKCNCCQPSRKDSTPGATVDQRRQASYYIGSTRCGCGKPKFVMSAVCPECWEKVPEKLKRGLVRALRSAFVVALMETQVLLGHKQTIKNAQPRKNKSAAAA